MGPTAQHCPVEGSGSAPGHTSTNPLTIWGLLSRSLPAVPPCPSAIFWEKETKGSKSGVGEGFSLSPSSSPHTPYFSAQRRCSYQKRLLKDDLFYFSLTFPSLGKWVGGG